MEQKLTNTSLSLDNLKSITFYSNHGYDPCAFLRLRGPMSHLGIHVIEGKEDGKTYPERVSLGDSVLIQLDFPRDLKTSEKIIFINEENL